MNESKVEFDGESLLQQCPGDSGMELGTAAIPPTEESPVQAPESAALCVSWELAFGDTTRTLSLSADLITEMGDEGAALEKAALQINSPAGQCPNSFTTFSAT